MESGAPAQSAKYTTLCYKCKYIYRTNLLYQKEVNESKILNDKGSIKNKQMFINELQQIHSKNSPVLKQKKKVRLVKLFNKTWNL